MKERWLFDSKPEPKEPERETPKPVPPIGHPKRREVPFSVPVKTIRPLIQPIEPWPEPHPDRPPKDPNKKPN